MTPPRLADVARRRFHTASLAAGVGWLTGGAALARTPQDLLVLAFAFDDIVTLDPAEAFEISAGEVMGNCYDRLVRFQVDDPSTLVGDLAASWAVDADGRNYRFQLKPGLKFASGRPLTAEDVVFSLRRAVRLDKTPAFILTQFGWRRDTVDQAIRATAPLTLELTTDRSYAPTLVLNGLTANVAAAVDRTLLLEHEVDGDLGHRWLRTNFAGSGPYRLLQWRANELLTLQRNPHHAGPPAPVERVAYRHVKESFTQRLLLEKGDVDVARNLSPQDLAAVARHPQVRTTATPKGTVYYLSLNQRHPILARPEVREAFKWLVPYEAIAATLIRDVGVIHQNFLPAGMLGASSVQPFKRDVARARALLARAGLANGFKVRIDVRSIQPTQGVVEALQRSVREAGIELEILPGDGKQTLTKYRARQHEIYIGQWGADYWDPHTNADTFARNPDNGDGARFKSLAWRNAWDIPALTRQSDAAALERDGARRQQLYEALQADFRRSSPFVMLYQQVEVAAHRASVHGLTLGPTADSTYLFRVAKV